MKRLRIVHDNDTSIAALPTTSCGPATIADPQRSSASKNQIIGPVSGGSMRLPGASGSSSQCARMP